MSATPLQELWEASAGQPFQPAIGKGTQFTVGSALLLLAFILSGLFGLSMRPLTHTYTYSADMPLDNTLKNVPLLGIPASLAFGYAHLLLSSKRNANSCTSFGAVYMICAVGVYV